MRSKYLKEIFETHWNKLQTILDKFSPKQWVAAQRHVKWNVKSFLLKWWVYTCGMLHFYFWTINCFFCLHFDELVGIGKSFQVFPCTYEYS